MTDAVWDQLPLVTATGAPASLGTQRGLATPERIRRAVAVMSVAADTDRRLAIEDLVRRGHPHLLAEAAALDVAVGLPTGSVLAMSAAADLTGRLPGWCSLVALRRHQWVLGKNLDTSRALADVQVVERLVPAGRITFGHVTTAGSLWTDGGVNEAGLGLANASLQAGATNPDGLPDGMIARELLAACSSVAEAVRYLRAHPPRTMGEAIMVVDAAGDGAVIEWLPTAMRVRGGAPLMACNRPLDQRLRTLMDPADPIAQNSARRETALEEALLTAGPEPFAAVAELLALVQQYGDDGLHTIAHLHIDPVRRELRVGTGPVVGEGSDLVLGL